MHNPYMFNTNQAGNDIYLVDCGLLIKNPSRYNSDRGSRVFNFDYRAADIESLETHYVRVKLNIIIENNQESKL